MSPTRTRHARVSCKCPANRSQCAAAADTGSRWRADRSATSSFCTCTRRTAAADPATNGNSARLACDRKELAEVGKAQPIFRDQRTENGWRRFDKHLRVFFTVFCWQSGCERPPLATNLASPMPTFRPTPNVNADVCRVCTKSASSGCSISSGGDSSGNVNSGPAGSRPARV